MSEKIVNHVTNVIAESKKVLPEFLLGFIDECLKKPHPESELISVLHMVQNYYGFLPEEQLNAVSQVMQIPLAKVTGVATFYHHFSMTKKGRFVISVCMGTACYVKGSELVAKRFSDELGIQFGETTKDGMFTLEAARCLGTCGLAPVVMIGETVHSQVTSDEVSKIIQSYIDKARAE